MNFRDIETNKKYSQFESAGRIRKCFFCNKEEAIMAHSISESQCLSLLLEKVNGQNITYGFKNIEVNPPYYIFRRFASAEFKTVGSNKASTFTGFCKHHDRELFNKIDNFRFNSESAEICFLHCYRAFARGYHKKMEERESCMSNIGYAKENHEYISIRGNECEIALTIDIGDYPKLINEWLIKEDYEQLYHLHIQTKSFLPIASASFIQPSFDIRECRINDYKSPCPLNHIFLNIIPEEDTTHILISCFKSQTKSIEFIDSLKKAYKQKEYELVGKFLTNLLVFFTENTFLKPSFANNLEGSLKDDILSGLYKSIKYIIQDEYLDNPIREEMDLFKGFL